VPVPQSSSRAERLDFDGVVVVGAGLAGLTAALAAAPRRVLVLSPTPLGEGCASSWAQGGMAAALADDDDPALHAADTIAAGAGLCEADAVRVLTTEGPAAVRALAQIGAPFDRRADGVFLQSLEAAHSRPRVARVGGDGAGRAIMLAVIAAVGRAPHIEVKEGVQALALIQDTGGTVRGVVARCGRRLVEIHAGAVILATGGLGGLYAVTTDPAAVRGEGLAMAALAGAAILDVEFVQFHPTAIDVGADPAPLATEALRGEGARLVDAHGTPFMSRYHPAAELAPRDVVARAIETERRSGRGAFLDARAPLIGDVANEFPAMFAACRARALDPREAPIPVLPAAHYHMGGVATDLCGAASLSGLFAAGECAATGVHGANRLASNSLLEAAVFGARAGVAARDCPAPAAGPTLTPFAPPALPDATLQDLRARMSRDAGVVRDGEGLGRLLAWLAAAEVVHGPALPLVAARLVAESSLARRESRGAHFRADHPAAAALAAHSRRTANDLPERRRRAA
jgi:L-aspartate oxidase